MPIILLQNCIKYYFSIAVYHSLFDYRIALPIFFTIEMHPQLYYKRNALLIIISIIIIIILSCHQLGTAIWMHYLDANETAEEARRQLHKNVASNIEQVPGGNTPQGTNYTATCLPSRKLYKLDEPDTQDTAGEAMTNSSVIYSYGPPHMAKQKQDDQLEHTYSSYVRIRDVSMKTCQKRWMTGRSSERGSGISVC